MAVICAVSLIVMTVLLISGKKKIIADFVPPGFDASAVQGTPDFADMEIKEFDSGSFKVSLCATPEIKDASAAIMFFNPETNTVFLKLRIMDSQGNRIYETGLIKPGEYISHIPLNKQELTSADISIKIMAYEPETYFSASAISVNTILK